MIPKTIHYCWYGKSPMTPLMLRCIDSWSRICPDFSIKLWNELNSPMNHPYVSNALKNKKWANISNFVRCYALYTEGGIYFDADIELLKSIDDLLEEKCFLGWEGPDYVNNAVFGAEKGNAFVGDLLELIPATYDGTESASLSSPKITTALLKKSGLASYSNEHCSIADVSIYPTTYFYPYSWSDEVIPTTFPDESYCIHYWSHSWKETEQQESISRTISSLDIFSSFVKKTASLFSSKT